MNPDSFLHLSLRSIRRAGSLIIAAMLGFVGCPVVSQASTPRYVEGQVIVTFTPATGLDGAKTVLARKSLVLAKHFGFLSAKRNRTMGLIKHPTKSTAQLIADLKDDPAVETVEPDYLRWVKAVPNDTRFASMWGLQNTGQAVTGTTGTAGDDVKFVEAWSLANPSANDVVVGVIDTGTNYVHPDLAANMWVNTGEIQGNGKDDDHNGYVDDYFGYDFANGLPNPVDTADASDPTNIIYHGTHVSGTIAATGNNNLGTIGVNYHAKIMALKVSSDGSSIDTSAEISAIEYATMMKGRGVNLVALNASFGGPSFSSAEKAAIQAAGDAGIVFCAAAGNGDTNGNPVNNDTTPTYPAGYRLANMIVVAATDQNDALASFSNYGATTVDIAAPGISILSTQPGTTPILTIGSNNYDFSLFTYSPAATSVAGAIYDCGLGYPADFPAAVKGHIALISRGTLNFSVKVGNAITAGATAVIIYNNVAGEINGTLGSAAPWIPSLAISNTDGLAIKAALPLSCSVTSVPGYTYLDGTSMATPHVTGAVSYAAANFPNDTVAQRIKRVLDNVDVKPSLQGKLVTNGRLNLLRIVDANQNGIPDWLEPSGANPPSISTPATLADGLAGTSYSQTLAATGGTSPYTWNVISGTLPAGLTLSKDGVLSGTPTMPGDSSFVVVVTDTAGSANGATIALTIADPPLSISSSPQLANGTANSPYQATLQAAGGTLPYSWTLSSGTLPAGLTLDSSGNLTGTPTTFGTYQFTAQVADVGGLTQSQVFTLTIDPLPLAISTGGTLPTGIFNVAYPPQPLNASGGVGSYVWSLSSGSLPDGLNLDPSGSISGTPTTPGASTFELQVQDGGTRTKTQSFTLAIDLSPLTISIPSTVSTTSTPAPLNPGVKGVPYLAESLSVSGGTPPYAWALNTGSNLPPGLKLTSTGLISGTPTTAGIFTFTATVTDKLLLAQGQPLQVTITSTYVKPVVSPPALGTTTVGVPFSYAVSASNYPKTFAVTGLPSGLTYSTTTGVISGHPAVGGTFNVRITATNPAGTSLPVTASLTVNSLDSGLVGSFTGLVARDPTVNGNLGSRLSLTTTSAGVYTAKITTGATAKSVLGYLATTTPQISVTVGTALLQLTLDSGSNTLSGTWGTAAVTGCRQTWSTTHPATSRVGYYSIGLDLADLADQGAADVPQGSGYASFSVATTGTLTVSGRTADGQLITCATIIGPNGEMPMYAPLYSNLGSLTGTLSLATPSAALADNTTTGTLIWSKPTSNTRTYRSAFGPTNLTAQGMYLAKAASGQIVLGLPAAGLANLLFTEGGLLDSATDPDVTGFTYTTAHTIILPKAGVTGNMGKATLGINKNTGVFTGTFTLVETTPKLTRTVAFQGIIVRPASGTSKGEGYFLLAQIPITGQTILTSPALSGRVVIDQ